MSASKKAHRENHPFVGKDGLGVPFTGEQYGCPDKAMQAIEEATTPEHIELVQEVTRDDVSNLTSGKRRIRGLDS